MKYLLALVIALGINYSFISPAQAQNGPVCMTKTQTKFLEDNSNIISEVFLIDGAELDTFMEAVNKYRAEAGGQLWRANVMLLGVLVDGSIGIVLFQDGCMIKDSSWNASKEDMFKMFQSNKSEGILKRLNLVAGSDA